MIWCTDTTESLRLVTSSTADTDVVATFMDHTTSGGTADNQHTTIASATTTTIVAAPGASTGRQLLGLSIRNNESIADNTVTLMKTVSGVDYNVSPPTNLGPGESLIYSAGAGWQKLRADGTPQISATSNLPLTSCLMAPHFSTAALTSTKSITTNNTFALYVGKAPRALSSAQVRARTTTGAGTITWAEVAIAKGSINVGGNPTLTVVGYTDVSATYNSIGLKTTTVNVAAGQSINEGDDLWVLFGNQATVAMVLRAASIADDLQVGLQASAAVRPFTIQGTPTAFTVEAATTLAPWCALLI